MSKLIKLLPLLAIVGALSACQTTTDVNGLNTNDTTDHHWSRHYYHHSSN